jgi:uncharacterized membrane protein HdeD (DUF308 family)
MGPRYVIAFVLGGIMIALGAFIGLRPLVGMRPVTQQLWLDLVFAAFFVFRGLMNFRTAMRQLRAEQQPPLE